LIVYVITDLQKKKLNIKGGILESGEKSNNKFIQKKKMREMKIEKEKRELRGESVSNKRN